MHSSRKQAERRERGEAFQEELRRSWKLLPNLWRLRITDGANRIGTRPADELVLTEEYNFLIEEKRTAADSFTLSMLRPDQIKGLLEFESTGSRNKGLVFVSFQNEAVDTAYAFRLVEALAFMKKENRNYILLTELRASCIKVVELPRIRIKEEPGYDLKGVLNCRL